MIYIGIDPGLCGAVAVIETTSISIFDTPIMEVSSNGKVRRKYDRTAMANLLRPYCTQFHTLVVLESVHSMPSQGVSSSFSFGEGLGIWEGILAAYSFSLEMPSPQRWKKEMLAGQGKDKSASRYKAVQLFPQMGHMLARVKDDGRAEALLLAEYGRRLRKE